MRLGPCTLALAVILLLSGCARSIGPDQDNEPVRVESIEARFEPGDRGELVLSLSVEGPGREGTYVAGLQWELWLDNRWFAAGTHRLAEPLPSEGRHAFTVEIPIVFRRAAPASGSATEIEVGVRGGLVLERPGNAWNLPFQSRRWLRVQNAPVVDDFAADRKEDSMRSN
ncbi:MAG: hypothetical protein WBV82_16130 [Myxococcaceae bacterium]